MRVSYGYKWRIKSILIYVAKIAMIVCIMLAGLELERKIICGVRGDRNKLLLRNIEPGVFRRIISISLPIIEITYNSGNVDSVSIRLRRIISEIVGWDIKNIATIINSEYPILKNNYKRRDNNSNIEKQLDNKEDTSISKSENTLNHNDSISENKSQDHIDEKEVKQIRNNESISADGKIIIRNETGFPINIDELLRQPLNIGYSKAGPHVLIYHTHTTESYIQKLDQIKDSRVLSRNSDPSCNVVKVGEELAKRIRKCNNLGVIHNGTVHTLPSDAGAYARSLNTAINILKSYPSISVVLDIHRDGLGGNEKLRTVTKLNNKNVAKIMFVVGTNKRGLEHPNWKENLKFAVKLQKKIIEQSPQLVRPIYISENRYNQHLKPGALIIEIGGNGNLISEAVESTKYLGKAISEVLSEQKNK